MKKLSLSLLCCICLAMQLYGQQKHSCCSPSASEQFASLFNSEDFRKSHIPPLPLNYMPERGTMIEFPTQDGKNAHAFLVKSAAPNKQYILVFHESWGLNDYIKRQSEMLQKEVGDVNILAVDLFDGKVTTDPEETNKLVQELKDERARSIIQGALFYIGPDAKVATLGWCMGGTWSMQAAIMAGKQTQACVMYYGMPEKDIDKLKTLRAAPVLGIFGTKDKWINPGVVKEFEKNAKSAGVKLTVKNYNAEHAFANPSNPQHDPKATTDAWATATAFLRKYMK